MPISREDFLSRVVARLEHRIEALEQRSTWFSRARLGLFLLGVAGTVVAFQGLDGGIRWLVPALFLAVFVVVARLHEALETGLGKHRLYRGLKESHIARIRREWAGLPESALPAADEDHPFARDLDLLGPRSLHHLLDTSFSHGGSRMLASWLTDPVPDPGVSLARQRLVRELVPLTPLRDRVSLLSAITAGHVGERFDGEVLLAWLGRHEDHRRLRPILGVLSGLALLTAVLVVVHAVGITGPWWPFSLAVYAAVYVLNSGLYSHLFDEAEHLHYQLERFRPVALRIERHRFAAGSGLEDLVSPFQRSGRRPSGYLRRVMWLAVAASAQKSEILRLALNVVAPWDLFFAWRLAKYKVHLKAILPEWLSVTRNLEALGSLATYAYLNPESCFPGFDTSGDSVLLESTGLGHPLIPRASMRGNDFRIDRPGAITLITGSNMSGKSTFLRSLGLARVMAVAGGAVDARAWQARPFRMFSCMGIHDSVTDGISFFYAEVRRLGAMMRQAREEAQTPLLVLVDEIFRGTNNRERLAGSRELLRELASLNVAAVVATHDLELAGLEGSLAGFRNRHFREEVEDGRMVFDYILREGPCPTTNALRIMELEGLPVPDSGGGGTP